MEGEGVSGGGVTQAGAGVLILLCGFSILSTTKKIESNPGMKKKKQKIWVDALYRQT